MDSGIECTLKFVWDSKLSGVVLSQGRDAIQRDLGTGLERWACVNFMKFKKAEYKVLHLCTGIGINGLRAALQRTWLQVDETLDTKTVSLAASR